MSCMCPSISMALSVGPPFIIPFILFGGYFLNSASILAWLKWLTYLSWFSYANEALLIVQWSSVGLGEIACTKPNVTCPPSGMVILKSLNFDEVICIKRKKYLLKENLYFFFLYRIISHLIFMDYLRY